MVILSRVQLEMTKKIGQEKNLSTNKLENEIEFIDIDSSPRWLKILLISCRFILSVILQVFYSFIIIPFIIAFLIYISVYKNSTQDQANTGNTILREIRYEKGRSVTESIFKVYRINSTSENHEIRHLGLQTIASLLKDEMFFLDSSASNFNQNNQLEFDSSNFSRSRFILKLICARSDDDDIPLITFHDRAFRRFLLLKLFTCGNPVDLLLAIKKIREIFPSSPYEISEIIDDTFLVQLPLSKALSFSYYPTRNKSLQKIRIILTQKLFNCQQIENMLEEGNWREIILNESTLNDIRRERSLRFEFLTIEQKKELARNFIDSIKEEKRKFSLVVRKIILQKTGTDIPVDSLL